MLSESKFLKVVLLGDQGVGKTALMKMYCSQTFEKSYQATIGADFLFKEFYIGDRPITLQIWDTAGQERFKSLVCRFYRGSDACILVYDITDRKSFERLTFWRDQFIEHADITDPDRFPFLIVGNKNDLNHETQVSEAQVRQYCAANGNIPYIQASAKVNSNVEEAFTKIASLALEIQSDYEDVVSKDLQPVLRPEDLDPPSASTAAITAGVNAQNDFFSGRQRPAASVASFEPSIVSTESRHSRTSTQASAPGFTLETMQSRFNETTEYAQSTLESWECC